jgi:hypothetical protein
MTPTSPRRSWPLWVRAVLWKTPNRSVARKCVWISLFSFLLCIAIALCAIITVWAWKVIVAAAVLAVLCFAAAILYDRATVWVDRHGTWG